MVSTEACVAEDEAEVVVTGAAVTVPYGSYTGCVETHDFTRLEPDANEREIHCPGVGLVRRRTSAPAG